MNTQSTVKLQGWICRLRTGDEAVFNELFQHFQDRLAALTRKMLGSFPDARRVAETGDVLQNASLRLVRALRDHAASTTAAGHVLHARDFFRLAALQIRRELLDLIKQYRRRAAQAPVRRLGDSRSDGWSGVAGGESLAPEHVAEWTEFHSQVAALPAKAREVFHLVWYGGLTQAEAAELLGVDVRTVKSRWQEARLTLHEKLGGRLPGA